MKNIILYMCLFGSSLGTAQSLDTLFSNAHSNTALFFPERIRQAVVGGKNFIFSYNEEFPQYFGLLKALPGPTSNLLVVTTRGKVYAYVVAHKENPSRLIHFFRYSDRIGSEKPVLDTRVDRERIPDSSGRIETDNEHLQKLSEYFLRTSSGKLKKKRKNGIFLKVHPLKYEGNEVYLVFTLENRSEIEFQPEYLRVYLSRGNRKRNASYQKIRQVPMYKHHYPESLAASERRKFVYVLPKFTIGDRERVEVELREKRGNRFLTMTFR